MFGINSADDYVYIAVIVVGESAVYCFRHVFAA